MQSSRLGLGRSQPQQQRRLVVRNSAQTSANTAKKAAKVKVVGVGGAASKLVHQLWETVPQQGTLDCIIIDKDPEALFSSPMPSDRKLLLGSNFQQQFMRTPSWNNILGREGVGKASALQSADDISDAVAGAEVVMVVAAVGGQTARGAAAVIADLAHSQGSKTVSVAALPRTLPARQASAQAVRDLEQASDALIVLPTHKLTEGSDLIMSHAQVYDVSDRLLLSTLRNIEAWLSDTNCFFGTDHKDLVSNMADGVTSIGCSGPVIGPDRAARAATAAYNSPLRLVDASKVPPSSVTFVVNAPWDGGSHGEILEIGEIVFEHSAAALTDFVVSYNTNSIGPISVTVFVTHDRTLSSSSSSVVQQAGATATTVEQQ